MVLSRGGVSGGLTIREAIDDLEKAGFEGSFLVRPGGRVECRSCGVVHAAKEVALEGMRRIEGASDPADMAFVGALECPLCHARGTVVIPYGPMAQASDGVVLRELMDLRDESAISHGKGQDHALVSDSGWLHGPDDPLT